MAGPILTRAVVLAAGRGTRMRAASDVVLDAEQRRAADRGLKSLMPFGGQPFLSWVLTEVADAGLVDVCIVTGPGADPVREHFERHRPERLRLTFAEQAIPLGSANALLAAEPFSNGEPIAVINADNLYPASALRALVELTGSGLVGFTREGLLHGNIDEDRLAAYALIEHDGTGALTGITEKPDRAALASAGRSALISMTCWRFSPGIFNAARQTPRSTRGEYELPDAVRLAMTRERFTVVPFTAAVPDLSSREDIPRVAALLHGRQVDL